MQSNIFYHLVWRWEVEVMNCIVAEDEVSFSAISAVEKLHVCASVCVCVLLLSHESKAVSYELGSSPIHISLSASVEHA